MARKQAKQKGQGSLFGSEAGPETEGNFNRIVEGKEAEEWFARHDRGEISIAHLIVETNGTWRIKGQFKPHKVQPPPISPYESSITDRPIFAKDAPEELKALEREVRAKRPTKTPVPAIKGPGSATKPANAAYRQQLSLFERWKRKSPG